MNTQFSWLGSQLDWLSDIGNGIGNVGTNNGQGNAPGATGNGNFNVGSGNGNNNGGNFNGNGNTGGQNGNNNGQGNGTLDATDTQAAIDAASTQASAGTAPTFEFDWRSALSDLNPAAEPETVDAEPAVDTFEFANTNGQDNTGLNNGVGNTGGFNGNNNGGSNNGNNNTGGFNGNNNGNDNIDVSELPSFESVSWQNFAQDWGDFFA